MYDTEKNVIKIVDGYLDLISLGNDSVELISIENGEFDKFLETDKEKDYYEGPYVVTPKSQEQILNTKNKFLDDNVEVKEIPYFETSNEFGTTVYIAKEIGE